MLLAKRKRQTVYGKVSATEAYTPKELTRRGFGPKARRDMKDSGFVKPRNGGRCVWYLGNEIVAWLSSK
jgi:hypothetical protein